MGFLGLFGKKKPEQDGVLSHAKTEELIRQKNDERKACIKEIDDLQKVAAAWAKQDTLKAKSELHVLKLQFNNAKNKLTRLQSDLDSLYKILGLPDPAMPDTNDAMMILKTIQKGIVEKEKEIQLAEMIKDSKSEIPQTEDDDITGDLELLPNKPGKVPEPAPDASVCEVNKDAKQNKDETILN